MHENLVTTTFTPYEEYFIDKKFFVVRTKISTYLYHPVIRKILFYQYTFGEVHNYNTKMKIKAINKNGSIEWDFDKKKSDCETNQKILNSAKPNKAILDEIKTYCPNYIKQKGYFFCEIFHKNKKMPNYYELLTLGDYCSFYSNSLNRKNYQDFNEAIEDRLLSMVTRGILSYNITSDHFYFRHYLGDFINMYEDYLRADYIEKSKIDLEYLNYWENEVKQIKDIGYRNYVTLMLREFERFVINNKEVKQCPICNDFFKYKENKIYCSEDCKIKAKNKRYYQKNASRIKLKNIK